LSFAGRVDVVHSTFSLDKSFPLLPETILRRTVTLLGHELRAMKHISTKPESQFLEMVEFVWLNNRGSLLPKCIVLNFELMFCV
jgi:hypothetical protein